MKQLTLAQGGMFFINALQDPLIWVLEVLVPAVACWDMLRGVLADPGAPW